MLRAVPDTALSGPGVERRRDDVKDRIRQIDQEYGFHLTEDEIESIAKQAEETRLLLQELDKVDVTGVMPMVKFDRKPGS